MLTSEQLAKLKAECLQAAQAIEDTDYTDFNADPAEVLALINEVYRLRNELAVLTGVPDENKRLRAEAESLRETIAQWEATAAEQSAAIERLRQRQPSDLEERDRTFSRVMPAMDLPRRTRDLRERLGE